jgi:K+-sensing histidine kinase KdpD
MISADLHVSERERLQTLLRYEILDTDDDQAFNELTQLASTICQTPISLISLVDDHRQWFKSKVGIDAPETPKNIAFCSHAILQEKIFEVPNALDDHRFCDNPLVTGAPDIRFYAGAPLIAPNGLAIGTLCVIDREAKTLTENQRQVLSVLAKQVISQLELRLRSHQLERMNRDREQLFTMISHDLRSTFNCILGMSRRLSKKVNTLKPEALLKISQSIEASSINVYNLLDEILQWSQQRLGSFRCFPKNQFLRPLVTDAMELLQDSLEFKRLQVDLSIDTEMAVFADTTMTKAVMRNLISNAVKFSEPEAHISISAKINQQWVIVSVVDGGCGIDKKLISKLFEQCVDSREGSERELGHGLGLSLCGEFINAQGGKIWVDEDYNNGAKVDFCLPRNRLQ